MDIRAAYFTPEQAREIMDMVALLKTSGMLRSSSRAMRPDDPGPHPVYVKNESGEEVPAFACMQVVGTEDVGDLTYVKIDKPDSTDGQYLFNGESPIESGGYGMSYPWGVVRMLLNGLVSVNSRCGPIPNSWAAGVAAGGPFVVYGEDNTGDLIGRGRILGDPAPIILYKFEITDTFDPIHHDATVATANLTPITGGDPDNGVILRDPERIFTGLPDGARGLALLQGGNYYIIQAACPEEEEPEE